MIEDHIIPKGIVSRLRVQILQIAMQFECYQDTKYLEDPSGPYMIEDHIIPKGIVSRLRVQILQIAMQFECYQDTKYLEDPSGPY